MHHKNQIYFSLALALDRQLLRRSKKSFSNQPFHDVCFIVPSRRHKGNSGFMVATPVGAIREPPLQFGYLLA
jgi:hypothetical protein